MPAAPTAIQPTKTNEVISVAPWAIEADHPRNCDLYIQCIPNGRLRSAIDGTKPAIDVKTGLTMTPLGQSQYLGAFPKTPGMQLHVNNSLREVRIVDPLNDMPQVLERINQFAQQQSIRSSGQVIKGVPTREEKLDKHSIKSLNREMYNLVNLGHAKVCMGQLPTLEEIDALPGEYLTNPGSRVPNGMPRFEKDMEAWVDRMHTGGR